MIDAKTLIRLGSNFQNIVTIYPPSVREVLANEEFLGVYGLLTVKQIDIIDEIKKGDVNCQQFPTPLEYLFAICQSNLETYKKVQKGLWIFCHEEVNFLFEECKIIIGNLEEEVLKVKTINEIRIISNDNYFDFQNQLRVVMGDKTEKPYEPPNPNEDPRVTRIKEKARERDRLIAKKGRKGGISFSECLLAICCMKIGITPLNIGEVSYAAIGPLMSMCQSQEKYHIDIKSLLAGADSKKIKPKYWIGNSENK